MLNSTMDLALKRAGFSSLDAFLAAKGIPASAAQMALMPYLVGYELHRIRPGDTYTKLAVQYGTAVHAIAAANPSHEPDKLQLGTVLIIPLGFSVVPEDIPLTSELLNYMIRGLEARYPMLHSMRLGTTEYGRNIPLLRVGQGPRVVYYNASHHANEYITTSLVMNLLERYLEAAAFGTELLNEDIQTLLGNTTLLLAPMVNPDGVDLVLGAVSGKELAAARAIGEAYPEIPFPAGWKANLRGVDLNLNYPARWDEARRIKYELGFDSPAPRDYVGAAPLTEQESRAMFDSTEAISPDLTISWHTQGQEIYWKFLDLEPEGSRSLGYQMAAASGYRLSEIPFSSSFAGYKDWFIQDFNRPGYTIEAGAGENPLPITQLPEMIQDNLPIFLLGLTGGIAMSEAELPEEAIAVTQPPVVPSTRTRTLQSRPLPAGHPVIPSWG